VRSAAVGHAPTPARCLAARRKLSPRRARPVPRRTHVHREAGRPAFVSLPRASGGQRLSGLRSPSCRTARYLPCFLYLVVLQAPRLVPMPNPSSALLDLAACSASPRPKTAPSMWCLRKDPRRAKGASLATMRHRTAGAHGKPRSTVASLLQGSHQHLPILDELRSMSCPSVDPA